MYEWVEKKQGEWWHAQVVNGQAWLGPLTATCDRKYYPPDMYVEFAAEPDGKPIGEACWHLRKLYNGKMPGDPGDEDEDYWHLCGRGDLADLIKTLTALGDQLAIERD